MINIKNRSPVNQNAQTPIELLLVVLFLIGLGLTVPFFCSGQTKEEAWILTGEFENELEADFAEATINTETEFSTELELEDNLAFEVGLANEFESNGENVWEAEFDFEAYSNFRGEEMELYLETDLGEKDFGEAVLGLEGSLAETDFDVGTELSEEEQIIYLDLGRRFDSGVSLRGGVELGNGPVFKNGEFSFRGVTLPLKDTTWELTGNLKTSLEKTPFGEEELLQGSLELENEKVKIFRFPKQGPGISFYRLIPLDNEKYQVVLFNSREDPQNLQDWSIVGGGVSHKLERKKIIPPGGKLNVRIPGTIVDNAEQLGLLNSDGSTEDTWILPRFYYGSGELYRREGVLERKLEVSFDEEHFDELTADLAIEIPSGPESFYFGDLELTHTGEIDRAAIGYEAPRSEMEILLTEGEIDIVYFPLAEPETIESEMGLKLNTEKEFEAVFEIAQDLGDVEWENVLEIKTEPGESEIELVQAFAWKMLELEVGYLFKNSRLSEFALLTAMEF